MDPVKASYGISDYRMASISLAQTTMRSEIGKLALDETFSERETVNENIVREIDKASEPWGVKMIRYEIKNINPSQHMLDTMEKQMEAERQKRAEITMAQGQKDSRINLSTGERQEAINLSEGEKQKRINEALGKAKEIEILADASARGIARIAAAIRKPGGKQAIRMRLLEQYIEEVGQIIRNANVSVLPQQIANMKTFFEGMGTVTQGIQESQSIEAIPSPPSLTARDRRKS
jgi:regulator of protease activity HflC (stomatin/prohibitin superfamily)